MCTDRKFYNSRALIHGGQPTERRGSHTKTHDINSHYQAQGAECLMTDYHVSKVGPEVTPGVHFIPLKQRAPAGETYTNASTQEITYHNGP